MKYIIILLITLFPVVSYAGSCGPTMEIETEYTKDKTDEFSQGSWNSGYGYDDRNEYGISLTLKIPLGTEECDEVRADTYKKKMEAANKKADAMEQRLRNFEKLLRICKNNNDLPICSKLDDMSRKLGLE